MNPIRLSDLFKFEDDKELRNALNLIKSLGKEYNNLIGGLKSASSQYSASLKTMIADSQKLAQSINQLNPTLAKDQAEIAKAAQQMDIYSSAAKSLRESINLLNGTIAKLEKERKQYNQAAEKTIKVDTELATLEKKLSGLDGERAQKIAVVKQQILEKNKALKQTAKESLDLVSLYQKEIKQLAELRNRYKDVAVAKGVTSREAKKLQVELTALDRKIKQVDAGAGQFQRNVGNYSSALSAFGGTLRTVASAFGFTGVIFTLVGAFRSAIDTIKNFQRENAILAGVLGTSRSQIKALTDDAERLGAITAKTATEVTKLQIEYARLGFTQSEILSLTEPTIAGSIALNAELDRTAALVGAVVRSFDDLDSTDGEQIVDQLTLAANRSALSFSKMETAIPIVAGAANASKIPFNEVLAVLGKLSDAGIDASTSATAFRNILIEAAGRGVDYKVLIDDIRNSTDKLTLSYDMFGKRGAVQAVVLAGVTEETKKLSKELREEFAGKSAFAANEMLNTLKGSTELATSAMQGFVLSLENGSGRLSKFFKAFIDGFTGSVSLVTAWNEGIITTSELVGSLTNPLIALEVQTKITAKTAIESFERQEKAAKNASEIQRLYNLAISNGLDTWEKFKTLEPDRIIDKTADSQEVMNGLQAKFTELLNKQAEGLADNSEVSISSLEEEIKLLKKRYDTASDFESRSFIGSQIESKKEQVKQLKDEGKAIQSNVEANDEYYEKYVAGTYESIKATDQVTKAWTNLETGVENAAVTIEKDIPDATDKAFKKSEVRVNTFFTKFDAFTQKLREGWEKFGEEIQTAIQGASDVVNQFLNNQSIKRQNNFAEFEELQNAEITKLEERRDRELENERLTKEAKESINRRYESQILKIEDNIDRRRRELARKQAKSEKAQAIFAAIINTAVAVTASLTNPILAAIVGTLGAAQVAAIASQPLPAFAKGTDNAPSGAKIVGEKGRELWVEPSGKVGLTGNKAEVRHDIPKGSKIIPNNLTEKYLRDLPFANHVMNGVMQQKSIDNQLAANEQSQRNLREVVRQNQDDFKTALMVTLEKENDYLVEQFARAIGQLPLNNWSFDDKGQVVRSVTNGGTIRKNVELENQY